VAETAPDRVLLDVISAALSQAIEGMTGERPSASFSALSEGGAGGSGDCAWWRQSFSFVPDAHVYLGAPESSWSEIGNSILKAAGIDDGDRESIRSTFTEILSQTFGGVARTLSSLLGKQVTTSTEEQTESGAASGPTFELHVSWGATGPLLLLVSVDAALLAAIESSMNIGAPSETAGTASEPANKPVGEGLEQEVIRRSRKMDLLLDVELPVSVSFGRAQLLLKDVIKLTTGSIIELNRSIAEPVDVIVNNCVIARGEVVVVEGNFGVRVHEVISRQERLRTLK
jgi:flagellar motor switch protein FliN